MEYIITFFPEFKKHALAELNGFADEVESLSSAVSVISARPGERSSPLRFDAEPIFVRHIMPVHRKGELCSSGCSACEQILDDTKKICDIPKKAPFSVQCRVIEGETECSAKDIEVAVGQYFERNGAVPAFSDREISNADVGVISVLIYRKKYYIGFSKSSENLSFHSDEYRVLSRNGRTVSRAENKLLEAINKFGIKMNGGGNALDVGASPGGWTKVLADRGYKVFAVDPGELHEVLRDDPRIVHLKKRIENCEFDVKFEIAVNDMNIDPQISSGIMCGLADNLEPGATAVLTLKLPVSDVMGSIGESCDILKERYEILTLKNLSHNRREVTVILKNKNL